MKRTSFFHDWHVPGFISRIFGHFYALPLKAGGFSLPEMLVVMIITGILFIGLFDGVGLIQRYSRTMYKRLEQGNELFYALRTMEELYYRCDSVLWDREFLHFYKEGKVIAILQEKEGCLWVQGGENRDTLLYRGALLKPKALAGERCDSVEIVIQGLRNTHIFSFGVFKKQFAYE